MDRARKGILRLLHGLGLHPLSDPVTQSPSDEAGQADATSAKALEESPQPAGMPASDSDLPPPDFDPGRNP